jgi:23S rRNA U2552 (ribose-2'-O)-methylase RlmE/FtsJ
MMQKIGYELDLATRAFGHSAGTSGSGIILDLCMAPGGFLATALSLSPGSSALAFTLPPDQGGHEVLLPPGPNVEVKLVDITMLAADMGVADNIPAEHADAGNFQRQKQLGPERHFDLVLCDGQVLRTHPRASYRERCESARLTVTQLALGLEHVRLGGTMVVLLHKLEHWRNVLLLYTFSKFASIKVFKPRTFHSKRSSFYMIASNIQSQHPEAVAAVERWKEMWRVTTFGTEEEYRSMRDEEESKVEMVLDEFGSELVRLGREVWNIQAAALARAPFIRTG